MAKNTHGGKRDGSGRKMVSDKKEAVYIYVHASVIQSVGGKEEAKTIAEQAILKKCKNSLKIV